MKFDLDGLTVYFPYDYLYPEQYEYMAELKRALDARGHGCLEMPTGTGKTITVLALVTSYQLAHPDLGKLIYCTRTVPEMEKVLAELRVLQDYRSKIVGDKAAEILAVGLSSRKNMCIHPDVVKGETRDNVDELCLSKTAGWVRDRAGVKRDKALSSNNRGSGGATVAGLRAEARAEVAATAGGSSGGNACDNCDGGNSCGSGSVGAGPSNGAGAGDGGAAVPDIEDAAGLCRFFEKYEREGSQALLPAGVYTLHDLRVYGREKGYCPYYLARHMIGVSNVIVYNYQYLLDPKIASMVSDRLEPECVVVFDEAHNIDNVCIEALSINVRRRTLEGARGNLASLKNKIEALKREDRERLDTEYQRLVAGLRDQGNANPVDQAVLQANPVIPADILEQAMPGNIRRAHLFVGFLRRFVEHLSTVLDGQQVEQLTPVEFMGKIGQAAGIEGKALKLAYDRLQSLLKTLEITATDEFAPLRVVADFGTLVATYSKGFTLILEPYDERYPTVPDPVLQLACLDASLAIKPVLEKYRSVIITSGTLSPLDLYPKLLNFHPVAIQSFKMTLTRNCLCPMVVTRGTDQLAVSTKFEMRNELSVMRNYGRLLIELAKVVPDGMVCFFVSYSYMDNIVNSWHESGILNELMQEKLVFIETQDVVETTLALDNFRRACDCGRGAVFLSIARGKVAEGIDFDRHLGRCVVMFGVPYQFVHSRTLQARLAYLKETFQIRESDFLSFDAIRQAAQCMGRVIRSKADYGLMVLADKRYNSHDKRGKLPQWITAQLTEAHLNLSTDMAVTAAQQYMREMGQPYRQEETQLYDQETLEKMAAGAKRARTTAGPLLAIGGPADGNRGDLAGHAGNGNNAAAARDTVFYNANPPMD